MINTDELINCLRRYDKDHEDYYQRYIDRLRELFSRLEPKDYRCTEDKQLAGTRKRVDLYIQTEKGHILIEAKLCLSSGGSLGRSPLGKTVETLETLDERGMLSLNDVKKIILLILVPYYINMDLICDKLRRSLSEELSEFVNERIRRDEIRCTYGLQGIPNSVPITVRGRNLKIGVKGNDIVIDIRVVRV